MHHLVFSGDKVFLPIDGSQETPLLEYNPCSDSLRLWKQILEMVGLNSDNHGADVQALFDLIKKSFEIEYNCNLNAVFISRYIAANEGRIPVKHDDASRALSAGPSVYIDQLMINVLFEYIANYYLWARFQNEVFSFCFPYALNMIDICCRQGYINSDQNITTLLDVISQKCDARGITFIADMYWSTIAFIMCHELAHRYIDSISMVTSSVAPEEIVTLADRYGFTVYSGLVSGKYNGLNSPFLGIFHDYLYAAPMVLFLFYEDLYFMKSWIYGETLILREHQPFNKRINQLLNMSREDNHCINLEEGDAVLASFWDISDLFREELFYKLKNGKLSTFIQKGYRNMSNVSGYEQALLFDNQVQTALKRFAQDNNIDGNKLIGLYNISVKFEVLDEQVAQNGLVISKEGKTVTIKPYNLRFKLAFALSAIIDTGVTLFSSNGMILTVVQLLRILIELVESMTLEITEEHARVLIECYRLHASSIPVEESTILKKANASQNTIDQLCTLKCIELVEGRVRLVEEIAVL